MDTKRLKKLMSILTTMAIIAMSFSGAFSVAAEDLYVVSVDDVTEAILEDHSETEETTLYDNDSYSVVASQGEGAINVVISAENVVKHENAEHTPGYWVGFAVEAPDGATEASGTFGGVDYENEPVVVLNETGDEGIAFYVNAGALTPKTVATLQWFNDEGAISEEETFVIDLTNVTLDIDYTVDEKIGKAIVADKDNQEREVYDEATYTVSYADGVVDIDMTKLELHKNGEDAAGFWTGFSVEAPEDADFAKYTFGETATARVEDIDGSEGDKQGISFYTNAANPKTSVKLQWFEGEIDGENYALSNPIELSINLDGVDYYKVDAENDITEAILFDNSTESASILYDSYRVNATQGENAINVAISAENVVKHKNGEDTPKDGYWVGFAVEAPEGADKANIKFREYEATDNVTPIDANGTMGIAFYINAGAENPKTTATLQWLDENGETLSEETSFNIDLSGVTLGIDYTPVIEEAKVVDKDAPERVIYEENSYIVTPTTKDDGTILVDIAMQELAEHTSDEGEGYWTGFAVKKADNANKVKYIFGNTADLVWSNAATISVEENVIGEEDGIAFYANMADAAPKKYAMLQWYNGDEAVSNIIKFEMNLDNVKLNWIKEDKVSAATPKDGEVAPQVTTTQNDNVINVALTAENVRKHFNEDTTPQEGYWVGFAVEAPNTEAKAKVTFGEYSNDNMTLEDIGDEKKGVAFYTNAGAAYPKTEAALQWVDAEGKPLSAPTTFVVDLTDVTLAELPYISAEDVSEAKIVDQSNTGVKPYSSYSVSAEADENGVIVVDIVMKSLKSHQNGEGDNGYWTGFAVAAPEGAVTMRYAFAADKESLSMSTAAVEAGVVTVDEVEKNGVAFYTDAFSTPKKYVRLQWFDENGEALTNATDFEMDLSGVKRYQKSGGSSGGSSLNYYTVKFETNGGSTVASVKAEKEKAISEPVAPVKDGYSFGGWYTDKELTEEYDFSSVVTKSFTLYAKWTEKSSSFADVATDAWYYETVKEAVSLGLMNGISETEFAPELNVTRAMFVTVLYRAAGQPKVEAEAVFSDVETGKYYTDAVVWANAGGIVNGVSETEFAPDSNITREQMAAILYRYAKTLDAEMTAEGEITYTDKELISDYAAEAIVWAKASKIMEGNEDGTFAPARNASRAEAAAVFVRFIDFLK